MFIYYGVPIFLALVCIYAIARVSRSFWPLAIAVAVIIYGTMEFIEILERNRVFG